MTDNLNEKNRIEQLSDISGNNDLNKSGFSKNSVASKENFDIADFIIMHSDKNNTKTSVKILRIISVIVVAAVIIVLCVFLAMSSNKINSNPVFGTWVSDNGNTMEIIEDYITINGSSRKYIFEEENIMAIAINNEYYKIVYKLEDGLLYIMMPDADGEVTTIVYEKKEG